MKNKIEGRLQKLEALTGVKKDGLTVCVWEFGKEKPMPTGEGLNVIIRRFCEKTTSDGISHIPPQEQSSFKHTHSIDEQVRNIVEDIQKASQDVGPEQQPPAELPAPKARHIDEGRYRSRDRVWGWMS